MTVEVINSQSKQDLFHFKVMQLKVHEDTKAKNECTLKFNFFFGMIKKRKLSQNRPKFDWDINWQPQ